MFFLFFAYDDIELAGFDFFISAVFCAVFDYMLFCFLRNINAVHNFAVFFDSAIVCHCNHPFQVLFSEACARIEGVCAPQREKY